MLGGVQPASSNDIEQAGGVDLQTWRLCEKLNKLEFLNLGRKMLNLKM